jgi:hypothetical protein
LPPRSQAWGLLESRTGNVAQARALFRACTAAAPSNAACWKAWIELEVRNELFVSADEVRAARDAALAAQHVETFSTLPDAEQRPLVDTVRACLLAARLVSRCADCVYLPEFPHVS